MILPTVTLSVAVLVCCRPVAPFSIPRQSTILFQTANRGRVLRMSESSGSKMDDTDDDTTGCSSTKLGNLNWRPMRELRETTDIDSLYRSDPTRDSPRLAKNEAYAKSVINSWNDQLGKSSSSSPIENLGAPFVYKRNDDGKPLGGYLVIPSTLIQKSKGEETVKSDNNTETVPAIILFHTGAGPQDIFLYWQADILARELGCAVLIADLLSDLEGWTWTDRERYAHERTRLLEYGVRQENNGSTSIMGRWKLQAAINSALDALQNIQQVDEGRIAALGWCFGGQPILELSRMNCTGVLGLASYHGVFDGNEPSSLLSTDLPISGVKQKDMRNESQAKVVDRKQNHPHPRALICNGNADPFVKPEDFQVALDSFEQSAFALQVLSFEGTLHGFTNPYQDINPDENFAYSEEAATKSWDSTIGLLHDVFSQ